MDAEVVKVVLTMNNDPNAIRLHISRLKKKLDEDNSNDFSILTEYGRGYTFTTD